MDSGRKSKKTAPVSEGKSADTTGSPPQVDPANIPVVAIGGSAGALEPLEAFFQNAPVDRGWCFVVIQHLSPDYRSMMDSLLSRRSSMTIKHIEDKLPLEANTIFLNKPNTLATVTKDGFFKTTPYDQDSKLPHSPIDSLFRSLALRNPARTVAVVVSGSGADGSMGGQLLHAAGGTVIVQSPSEATFSSMPRSLMNLGVVDHVAEAGDIPDLVINSLTKPMEADRGDPFSGDATRSIMSLLERKHHLDISSYKSLSVNRRILRRMSLRGETSLDSYVEKLHSDDGLLDALYHDLLIGVTEFYRDPESIRALREEVLEPMVSEYAADRPLRIWVPGCSSGEEAYTIAIELSEALRSAGHAQDFRILATDIHRRSIDIASAGVYDEATVQNVPEELRDRYFRRDGERYVVQPSLRQKIIFSVNDVLNDPPFLNLDLISCRNLLIYLRPDAQKRVVSMFLFGLRKNGILMLGPSETLGAFSSEFDTINGRWRLFRKVVSSRPFSANFISDRMGLAHRIATVEHEDEETSSRYVVPRRGVEPGGRNRDALIKSYNALLKRYAPSSILITSESEVLSWFGAASAFIDTKNNLADWTVEDIVHPDLQAPISIGIEKLRLGDHAPQHRAVTADLGEGRVQKFTLIIEPLDTKSKPAPVLLRFMLDDDDTKGLDTDDPVAVSENDDTDILARRIQELERDLKFTEETLQHVTERLEASGEELQASNEELQASNEELQASNEELQSSNEELHAVNEELITVSSEHERKIDLLSTLNDQTENVLKLLRIGTMFLDRDLLVQRHSLLVAEWFGLEPHDFGRKLSVIGPRLDFVDLDEVARRVLETGEPEHRSGQYQGVSMRVEVHGRVEGETRKSDRGVLVIFRQGGDIEPAASADK
ncbi:CheR family methyltransferase [Pacificoceanicola onchidii]|uniref:CheR family methyltransferase n=1 Tax=Pacificoceanicola onchidii TaxID=2562685 RepID=UPI0010A63FF4|nr:CheR family methyltransferase [Pacificoceanicola onchidii]